jgi:hypothetical protein
MGGSSITSLMDRAQHPHCARQLRWRNSSLILRGRAAVVIAIRTSWTLSTLQEQMIIRTWTVPSVAASSSLNRPSFCCASVYRLKTISPFDHGLDSRTVRRFATNPRRFVSISSPRSRAARSASPRGLRFTVMDSTRAPDVSAGQTG